MGWVYSRFARSWNAGKGRVESLGMAMEAAGYRRLVWSVKMLGQGIALWFVSYLGAMCKKATYIRAQSVGEDRGGVGNASADASSWTPVAMAAPMLIALSFL